MLTLERRGSRPVGSGMLTVAGPVSTPATVCARGIVAERIGSVASTASASVALVTVKRKRAELSADVGDTPNVKRARPVSPGGMVTVVDESPLSPAPRTDVVTARRA